MTFLLVLPVVLALLFIVAMPFCHGTDEQDARMDRVDRALDRENAGWRNR